MSDIPNDSATPRGSKSSFSSQADKEEKQVRGETLVKRGRGRPPGPHRHPAQPLKIPVKNESGFEDGIKEENDEEEVTSDETDSPSLKPLNTMHTINPALPRHIPACTNCRACKVRCDQNRPCSRCVRSGKADQCQTYIQKKRGRPLIYNDPTVIRRRITAERALETQRTFDNQEQHQLRGLIRQELQKKSNNSTDGLAGKFTHQLSESEESEAEKSQIDADKTINAIISAAMVRALTPHTQFASQIPGTYESSNFSMATSSTMSINLSSTTGSGSNGYGTEYLDETSASMSDGSKTTLTYTPHTQYTYDGSGSLATTMPINLPNYTYDFSATTAPMSTMSTMGALSSISSTGSMPSVSPMAPMSSAASLSLSFPTTQSNSYDSNNYFTPHFSVPSSDSSTQPQSSVPFAPLPEYVPSSTFPPLSQYGQSNSQSHGQNYDRQIHNHPQTSDLLPSLPSSSGLSLAEITQNIDAIKRTSNPDLVTSLSSGINLHIPGVTTDALHGDATSPHSSTFTSLMMQQLEKRLISKWKAHDNTGKDDNSLATTENGDENEVSISTTDFDHHRAESTDNPSQTSTIDRQSPRLGYYQDQNHLRLTSAVAPSITALIQSETTRLLFDDVMPIFQKVIDAYIESQLPSIRRDNATMHRDLSTMKKSLHLIEEWVDFFHQKNNFNESQLNEMSNNIQLIETSFRKRLDAVHNVFAQRLLHVEKICSLLTEHNFQTDLTVDAIKSELSDLLDSRNTSLEPAGEQQECQKREDLDEKKLDKDHVNGLSHLSTFPPPLSSLEAEKHDSDGLVSSTDDGSEKVISSLPRVDYGPLNPETTTIPSSYHLIFSLQPRLNTNYNPATVMELEISCQRTYPTCMYRVSDLRDVAPLLIRLYESSLLADKKKSISTEGLASGVDTPLPRFVYFNPLFADMLGYNMYDLFDCAVSKFTWRSITSGSILDNNDTSLDEEVEKMQKQFGSEAVVYSKRKFLTHDGSEIIIFCTRHIIFETKPVVDDSEPSLSGLGNLSVPGYYMDFYSPQGFPIGLHSSNSSILSPHSTLIIENA